MPTIIHFEIPAVDVERSKKFYSDLFGWKIEKFQGQTGCEDMEYWLITTTDDKWNKELGGGIMKRQGPQQPIINHIDVKSVDEYSSKVQQLGGKVHQLMALPVISPIRTRTLGILKAELSL
jgi:uncharacterized protein